MSASLNTQNAVDQQTERSLSHVPWQVLKSIVDYSDTMSKLSLRQCSKAIRNEVDKATIRYHSLDMEVQKTFVTVCLWIDPNHCRKVRYFQKEDGGCFVRYDPASDTKIGDKDFMEMAVEKVAKFFKDPRLSVETFTVDTFSWALNLFSSQHPNVELFLETFDKVFKEKGTTLRAKDLILKFESHTGELTSILPRLEPGTLESIGCICERTNNESARYVDLEPVVNTIQWKQAKELVTNCIIEIPFQDWSHFQRVKATYRGMNMELLHQILNNFDQGKTTFVDIRTPTAEISEFIDKINRPQSGQQLEKTGGEGEMADNDQPTIPANVHIRCTPTNLVIQKRY